MNYALAEGIHVVMGEGVGLLAGHHRLGESVSSGLEFLQRLLALVRLFLRH